jgi:hypothetical protein
VHEKRSVFGKMLPYLIASACCALFAFVYSIFSHGVHSAFMTWMFLIPLAGAVVSVAMRGRKARATFASSVLTFTLGSCFAGVLEIYGTTSMYTPIYCVAGIILLVIAIVLSIKGGFEA